MTNRNRNSYIQSRGLALVAVLWLVVILIVIVTVAGRTVRLDSRVSLNAAEQVRAKWALRAGVEKAIAILKDDDTENDTLSDTWTDPIAGDTEDSGTELQGIQLDGCTAFVEIKDEAAKLNLNTATKAQLVELPGMTEEIAASLLDWRDKDDDPGTGGGERGYYLNLDIGYQIRNGDFKTVCELLLVKGVTPEIFWGQQYERQAVLKRNTWLYPGNQKNERPAKEEENSRQGLFAYLTCYSYDRDQDAGGNDRVNINTADENRLTGGLSLTKSQAKWIVDNRKDNYKSIADLIDENSKKEPDKDQPDNPDQAQPLDLQTFADIADKITVAGEETLPGRVNVNTASHAVLAALLEGDHTLADSIIQYRQSSAAGLSGIGELLKVKGLTVNTFKKIADQVTTRSSVFEVHTMVLSQRTRAIHQVDAIVDRRPSPAAILYWRQGENH